jgi:hypothetical protein
MALLLYEVSFKGAASDTLAAAFDNAELTTDHGVTTVHAGVRDQADLQGLLGRVHALGLELLEVRLVAEPGSDDLAWIDGP